MNSKREAKRILRAFGKEEGKARINYVDSFLPEKTSFVGSISYRHSLRKVAIVVLLMVLILAMTVSVYAGVMHYLNYKIVESQTNDRYEPIDSGYHPDGTHDEIAFFEPKYIPDGFTLRSEEYDEVMKMKIWTYSAKYGKHIVIQESPPIAVYIDNERSTRSTEIVEDTEVAVHIFDEGGIVALLQYDETLIMVSGDLSIDELKKIVEGLIPE